MMSALCLFHSLTAANDKTLIRTGVYFELGDSEFVACFELGDGRFVVRFELGEGEFVVCCLL